MSTDLKTKAERQREHNATYRARQKAVAAAEALMDEAVAQLDRLPRCMQCLIEDQELRARRPRAARDRCAHGRGRAELYARADAALAVLNAIRPRTARGGRRAKNSKIKLQ